jgi:hypothetical protein
MMSAERDHRPAATSQAHDIVTHDGSELARALRARGWVVRAGWRSSRCGEPVWLVRLVCPVNSGVEPMRTNAPVFGLGLAA